MYLVKLLFMICVHFSFVSSDSGCKKIMTCGDCIGYAYDTCVWCSAKEHDGRRCQSKYESDIKGQWCKEIFYDPQPVINIEQNYEFNTGETGSKIVQFRPQLAKIKARPGVPIKIQMSYKPAKDYPLDVYYLMDYSFTMHNHSETLRKQGLKIYEQLTQLTNNVHFGIGSFVDKPALPFSGPASKESYSFRNHVSLTDNMTLFIEAVKQNPDGTNYDDPEGGFDALMQVMVCKDQIGWRDNARHIIILSTDATSHCAGDGKLVGAIEPHDMKCYLDNGFYSMALHFDYPSISLVNKVVMEKKIKIIFAVDPKNQREYEALEEKIQGAKYVQLDVNSNLVEIIKNEYLELIRNVEITPTLPSHIMLALDPDCSKSNNNCKIKHNEPLEINATLTVKYCPENKNRYDIINIGPTTLAERLLIEIVVDCNCECEKQENVEANSTMCNQHGMYQCGICQCNVNRYGNTCNCSRSSTEASVSDSCKMSKNDTKLCSGRGTCNCGICECDSLFSGQFCEFSNDACFKVRGTLCAGNGICRNGNCQCNEGWTEADCSCPDHNRDCILPFFNEVCSSNGDCKCGKCICKHTTTTKQLCSGRFCDDCEEFNIQRCLDLEDYASCNTEESKPVCDQKYNKINTTVELVSHAELNTEKWLNEKLCYKLYDNGSALVFKYHYPIFNNETLDIIIQKELEVPAKPNIWVAIWSVIGAIILIGLLTAITWMILINLYDKREYEKLLQQAGYGITTLNPLYSEPTTTFNNPAYTDRP